MFQETKELTITGPTIEQRRFELFNDIMHGCIMFPRQVFYYLYEGDDGACVLGAANANGKAHHLWAGNVHVEVCPDPDCTEQLGPYHSLIDMMIHLNNQHRWTREKIAGWIINS